MAEYDAFGNKIEEGTSPSTPASSPTPMGSEDSAFTAMPEPAPTPEESGLKLSGRPSRFSGGVSGGRWVGVVVLVVIIGAGALVAWQATDKVNDTIRSFTPTISLPQITVQNPNSPASPGSTAPATPEPEKPAAAPVGLGPRSMIRHAAFASAMQELQDAHFGNVTFIRVAPDRIDAQLAKGGYLRNVQIGSDGELRRIGTPSGPGFSPPTIAYADINTRAPERLVRGGVSKGGVKRDGIDYLVISKFGDDVIWNAYFKNNVRYQGDASGRVERKF